MEQEQKQRENTIVKISAIGILANIVLAAFKAFVGILTNSIAVTLDAVNNLSDALSSLITIIGVKLSAKPADQKHPFGYGRIEYFSQMIIAVIVLYAGITSLIESVKKIMHPEETNYTTTTFVILVVAIIVKLFLSFYFKKKGEEVHSGSLIASGTDAGFDAILSASVILSAVLSSLSSLKLESWVGGLISFIIIKSGLEIIKDSVDEMIGVRSKGELSKELKKTIAEEAEVNGVYDLILNNYGPDRYIASAHVEIPSTMKASEIDLLTRRIQDNVYKKHSVVIAAIGIYAINMDEKDTAKAYEMIREISMSKDGVLQMHGFSFDQINKRITFDVVIDFAIKDRKALLEVIRKEVASHYPDYEVYIALDNDYSD